MPIEVVFADHQNKPDIAANAGRKWFDTDKVDAILDVASSSPALAVLEIAKEKKKIITLSSPGSTRITNECVDPMSFIGPTDTFAIANSTGKALVSQGFDTWYFVTADYAFGQSLEKDTGDVVKASGGKVAGATNTRLGTADFASVLLQAQSSKAKVGGARQCRRRHHQLDQAGGRVRLDSRRPEALGPGRIYQRRSRSRLEGRPRG